MFCDIVLRIAYESVLCFCFQSPSLHIFKIQSKAILNITLSKISFLAFMKFDLLLASSLFGIIDGTILPSKSLQQNIPVSMPQHFRRDLAYAATSFLLPLAIGSKTVKAMAMNQNTEGLVMTNLPDTSSMPPFEQEINGASAMYTKLGSTKTCRILNGMWQVSGAHGFEPDRDKVVAEMAHCASEGFTTFDLADIYGPAESLVGDFCYGNRASSFAKECQFFTKWVPYPEMISRKQATEAIQKSLFRMKTDSLDLLQFHWYILK